MATDHPMTPQPDPLEIAETLEAHLDKLGCEPECAVHNDGDCSCGFEGLWRNAPAALRWADAEIKRLRAWEKLYLSAPEELRETIIERYTGAKALDPIIASWRQANKDQAARIVSQAQEIKALKREIEMLGGGADHE